jgi:hypothetical protein
MIGIADGSWYQGKDRRQERIVHAAGSGCATPLPDDLVMALS